MSALESSVFEPSYIRRARHSDIASLKARAADEAELWAGFRHTPHEAAEIGLASSDAWSIFLYGSLAGVFGVVPHGTKHGVGCPWAILSPAVEMHPRPFLRASRQEFAKMQEQFYYLINYVDARNTTAVRWLNWLGFTVYEPEDFGVDQLQFHRFDWAGPYV